MYRLFGIRTDDIVAQDQEYIAGLDKGLALIEAFGEGQYARLTISEASALTGLSRASARRCLRTLERSGYVVSDGKHFAVGARVLRLGHAYVSTSRLVTLIQPLIEASSERLGESMSVAVLDRHEVLVVARSFVRRSLAAGLPVGSRLPLHCSANGRVLLSRFGEAAARRILKEVPRAKMTVRTRTEIDEIMAQIAFARTRGYAINDQEVEIGVRTLAVPIIDSAGVIVASVSMSISRPAGGASGLHRYLPELRRLRTQAAEAL